MSFWKYFWNNAKFWILFVVFIQLFALASHLIAPLKASEWVAIESFLVAFSFLIIVGDYLGWKKAFKK